MVAGLHYWIGSKCLGNSTQEGKLEISNPRLISDPAPDRWRLHDDELNLIRPLS